MKHLPFDEALSKAQTWVGSNNIYAIGESLDDKGEKVILVFTSDSTSAAEIIPKTFYGHKVLFHDSDEIVPQRPGEEE